MNFDYNSIRYITRMTNLGCIIEILKDDFLFSNCYYEDTLDEIDRHRDKSKGGNKAKSSRI